MRRLVLVLSLLAVGAGAWRSATAEEPLVIAYVEDSVDHVAAKAVMEEAYERLGVEVEFQGFEAAEALKASSSGRVGAELQRIDGIQRRFPSLLQVPIPINYIQGMAVSKKYNFPVLGWHSLQPYRVGIVKGILFAERGTEGMDVKVAETYPELIRWIDDGTVDVGVMPRISGLDALNQSGKEDVREMDGILETLLAYHYLHVSRADLKKRLSVVLKEMLLDGTTQRLRKAAHAKILGEDR